MQATINSRIYVPNDFFEKYVRLLNRGIDTEHQSERYIKYLQVHSYLTLQPVGSWDIFYNACTPIRKLLPSDRIIIPDIDWNYRDLSEIIHEAVPSRSKIIHDAVEKASPECIFIVENGVNFRHCAKILNNILDRLDYNIWGLKNKQKKKRKYLLGL